MQTSYIVLTSLFFLVALGVDSFYTKTSKKYGSKLFFTWFFIFGIFFFLDYAGVLMNLWGYTGEGIVGVYFLSMPLEEYLFILTTPYEAIILWEAFHKAINTKRKKK